MATMIGEVHDALREAGAPDDKARKAAEALALGLDTTARLEARMDLRFAEVDRRLATFEANVERRLSGFEAGVERRINGLENRLISVEGNGKLLAWMLGFTLAGIAALVLRAFAPGVVP